MFKKYHYLNTNIHKGSKVYVATIWGKIVGFIGVIHFPHPIRTNIKRVTRLVVLPDYQGIGIGTLLLNEVAKIYKDNYSFMIVTSHPAINRSLSKNNNWKLMRQGRQGGKSSNSGMPELNKTLSKERNTCSWMYKK